MRGRADLFSGIIVLGIWKLKDLVGFGQKRLFCKIVNIPDLPAASLCCWEMTVSFLSMPGGILGRIA